jgi:hypothetical protein
MMELYFRSAIKAILMNRLFIEDSFEKHPEILDVPIQRPLFIVGLARTGSTLLHRLMARNSACRVLLYWEMNFPFIGSNLGLNHQEFSLKLTELKIKETYKKYPNYRHIHEINARDPEECNVLMRHSFTSLSIASEWLIPEFGKWLVKHDMTDSYKYYRKLLQLVSWYKPGDFLVLKCPSHLLNLKTILKVFLDANILWLHRDPLKTLPSYLDLLTAFWPDQGEEKSFIEFIRDYSLQSLETGMAIEKQINPARFLNLSYKELVADPVQVIHNIYKYFNYKMDSNIEKGIRDWLAENPRHKHGVHRYSPETFGLSEQSIKNLFSDYYSRYGHLI